MTPLMNDIWSGFRGTGAALRGLLCLAVVIAVASSPAEAGDLPQACATAPRDAIARALVLDPLTGDHVASDGRRFHQAELIIPSPFSATDAEGTFVIAPVSRSPDRWGRQSAHLVTAADGVWLAHELVAEGRAIVAPWHEPLDCLRPLFAAEAAARAKSLGIWSRERVWGAHHPERLLAQTGRYTLVSGRVLSVGETARRIYLNFGGRWSEDMTVSAEIGLLQEFTNAGLDVRSLKGAAIRVRGVVQQDRGPHIELRHPAQIERLEKDGPSR